MLSLSLVLGCSDGTDHSAQKTSSERARVKATSTESKMKDDGKVGDQSFLACDGGDSPPIHDEVYQIPETTASLPSFDSLTPVSEVCLKQFNISPRSWSSGFPGSAKLDEWFGIKFKAQIVVAENGLYRFALNSDDGSKLFLDGELVIDNDGTHAPVLKQGSTLLSKGSHELVVEYFQGPRYTIALELSWLLPSQNATSASYSYIPAAAFRQAAP